jgi:four helix bundle protein
MIAVVLTYRLSMAFPADERFGLSAQMRRAAVSVPSNIAEGQARKSPRAFIHYIGVALGSLAELDTQLDVAIRLQYISAEAAGRASRGNRKRQAAFVWPPSVIRHPSSIIHDILTTLPSNDLPRQPQP